MMFALMPIDLDNAYTYSMNGIPTESQSVCFGKNKKSLFQYNYDDGMIGMLFGEHKHIHILGHDFEVIFFFSFCFS